MYRIGINGSFIRKPASGMGQVSWHFVRTLLKTKGEDADNKYIIYLEEKIPNEFNKKNIPRNVEFKIIKGKYKRDDLIRKILWEKYWLPAQAKKDECDKFISLYQSTTIFDKNIEHTMLVHDVVPKIFLEYLGNFRKKVYYKLVDKAIIEANKIKTVSEHSKKDIVREYGIEVKNISVAYVACDPIFKNEMSPEERIRRLKKYNLKQQEKFVFYEGGLDIRKNLARVIKSYGKLAAETGSTPTLVIAGSFHKHLVPLVTDIEEEIKNTITKYKLDKKLFKTVGFVEQEDLPAFFQSTEVFIYPSLYEGFGMPVLEAMTSGRPVVTSNTTSIPEVISREAGYLINNPEDIDEIKAQLKKALTDSEENKSKKIVLALQESKQFTWEKFMNKVLEQ